MANVASDGKSTGGRRILQFSTSVCLSGMKRLLPTAYISSQSFRPCLRHAFYMVQCKKQSTEKESVGSSAPSVD